MKFKFAKALILTGFTAFSVFAQESNPAAKPPEPPDKAKLSYALGMNTGMLSKNAGADVDVKVFIQAVKDVLEGKPTELKESEVMAVLNQARNGGAAKKDTEKVNYAQGMRMGLQLKSTGADVDLNVLEQGLRDVLDGKPTKMQAADVPALFQQAQAYEFFRKAEKNKAEGEAFLAKNAQVPGVTVLPNGLQYRVLQAGTGRLPTIEDLLVVKYKCTLIDGTVIGHHDRFPTRIDGGVKAWQEALPLMKIGSKWQLFAPPALAFGHEGESYQHIGPDSTLIYELELTSVAPPGGFQLSTGLGHGLDAGASSPPKLLNLDPGTVIQNEQTNAVTGKVPPAKNQ